MNFAHRCLCVVSTAIGVSILLAASSTLAGEPDNNNKPWMSGSSVVADMSVIAHNVAGSYTIPPGESVSSSDSDYHILLCGGNDLETVRLEYGSLLGTSGTMELALFAPDLGFYSSGSNGPCPPGSTCSVTIPVSSFNAEVMVARIIASGSTVGYKIRLTCP